LKMRATFTSSPVQLYSLQRGAAPGGATQIGAKDISTPDLLELCHRLGELDLVVSVDTMVAHLAGALGYEPWVMLHADCDWRWPVNAGHSIWYPRARLFQQRAAGDWASAVEIVCSALAERVAKAALEISST
jgi:ADP-heptose:LPS heptosyltransferase